VCQQRVGVSFDKCKVPKPFYDRCFEEDLALCDIIFFINRAAREYYFVIVGA
jgi:hypothetical protein